MCGALLTFFTALGWSVICMKMKEKTVGILGIFFAHLVDLLCGNFVYLVSSFFLKLSDPPVKYIVKLFCLFMVMGAKGFSYIMSTSHSHGVRGSVVVLL